VEHETVPAQRSSAERSARERATRGLALVREATERLLDEVSKLDDPAIVGPSRLPGWTRAHVVTHLARNADAWVNLLTWARTGIEHPMYASRADRDADIEEGAHRLPQVIREDLLAACHRLGVAADRLTGIDWLAPVAHRTGRVFPACEIPAMRLFEVWVHLVDLGAISFDDVPVSHLEALLEIAVYPHVERTEGVPVQLVVDMPDGGQHKWLLVIPGASIDEVNGTAAAMLGWLAGRGGSAGLPIMPAWG
jgi:maleylpyruvate isomerase